MFNNEFFNEENIGKSLSIARKFLGITQEQFSKELGIGRKMLVQLENNKDFNKNGKKLELDDKLKETLKEGLDNIVKNNPKLIELFRFLDKNKLSTTNNHEYIVRTYNLSLVLDIINSNFNNINECIYKIIFNNKKMTKKMWRYRLSSWNIIVQTARKMLIDFCNGKYENALKYYGKAYIESLSNFGCLYIYEKDYARCLHINNISYAIEAQKYSEDMFEKIGIEINSDYRKDKYYSEDIIEKLVEIKEKHKKKLTYDMEDLLDKNDKISIFKRLNFIEENKEVEISQYIKFLKPMLSFSNILQHDNFRFLMKCRVNKNVFYDKITKSIVDTFAISTNYLLNDILNEECLEEEEYNKVKYIKQEINKIMNNNKSILEEIYGINIFNNYIFDEGDEEDEEDEDN
ncbi:hypothetical protein FDB39_04070 [Clostridium botulinum]|nr:hypothetical protein [Clostridium botulinum]